VFLVAVKFTSEEQPDDCYTVSCSGEVGTMRAFFLEGRWYDATNNMVVKPIAAPWFWDYIGTMKLIAGVENA